jgi:hypothetical protein
MSIMKPSLNKAIIFFFRPRGLFIYKEKKSNFNCIRKEPQNESNSKQLAQE